MGFHHRTHLRLNQCLFTPCGIKYRPNLLSYTHRGSFMCLVRHFTASAMSSTSCATKANFITCHEVKLCLSSSAVHVLGHVPSRRSWHQPTSNPSTCHHSVCASASCVISPSCTSFLNRSIQDIELATSGENPTHRVCFTSNLFCKMVPKATSHKSYPCPNPARCPS